MVSETRAEEEGRAKVIAGASLASWFVLVLCWVAVVFDGYDLIV